MARNTIYPRRVRNPRLIRAERPEVIPLESRRLLAILTVNTSEDSDKRDHELTLREAIRLANGELDLGSLTIEERSQISGTPIKQQADEIRFAIPGSDKVHTIEVKSALPNIVDTITIDGYTQPGAIPATNVTPAVLKVVIDGKFAGDGVNGLQLEAPDCLIRGLVINQFRMNVATQREGFGIAIGAGGARTRVEGCYLGTDAEGVVALGNQSGIGIFSAGNTIGGITPAARNVISGNGYNGIQLGGTGHQGGDVAYPNVTSNRILGCYIGLNALGDERLPNDNGIRITQGARGNFVGSPLPGGANVLSGNRYQGLLIDPTSGSANVVQANRIGTDPQGLTSDPDGIPGSGDEFGNGDDGIDISGGADHIVGGPSFDYANVIGGNGGAGILVAGSGCTNIDILHNLVGCDVTGTRAIGNKGPGVELQNAPGNRVEDNVLSGNAITGLRIYGGLATKNTAQGNKIGTDISGTDFLGNGQTGVHIWDAPENTIGGERINVISGNGMYGVYLSGATATGNEIRHNHIGTDVSGMLPLGNFYDGLRIVDAPDNTIGGTSADTRNVISGNSRHGIQISGPASSGNTITFNYIGMGIDGSIVLPNEQEGVVVRDASGVLIGTTGADGRGNLISGNLGHGVRIEGAGCVGTQVASNYIGTDVNGLAKRGNGKGGVLLEGTSGVIVGGERSEGGNLISGHGDSPGIAIRSNGANVIQGNYIGTDKNGEHALPNFSGVDITNSALNLIGGPSATLGNLISGNLGEGVLIFGAGASGNQLQGNLIGLGKDGDLALGNGGHGVSIQDASLSEIGTTTPSGSMIGNVISANRGYGVFIQGPNTGGTTLRNNFIGTNRPGDAARGNDSGGVKIENSRGVTIGGTLSPEGNLISGNAKGPALIVREGGAHLIQGNYIGSDYTGTYALPNGSGIEIHDASRNSIGGPAANRGNRIGGNLGSGVMIDGLNAVENQLEANFIGVQRDGVTPLPNMGQGVFVYAPSNRIGVAGGVPNVISGNAGYGVLISLSTGNVVQNNRIGTDPEGGIAVGNALGGILLEQASFSRIGGSILADEANLISGHRDKPGVSIREGESNKIEGNFIGCDRTGKLPLPNDNAITIVDSQRNSIGGAAFDRRNVISGNTGDGILIDGPSASLNALQGNLIGLDSAGIGLLPNGGHGIVISGPSNYVGVTPDGLGNVISGNLGFGIVVESVRAVSNTIQNNFIGTNLDGTEQRANLLGGIILLNVSDTLIGGVRYPEGNLISGHAGGTGITIRGGFGNRVEGNVIGTDKAQTRALGNLTGVVIENSFRNIVGASANSPAAVGGVADPARGNRIAGNLMDGIRIEGVASQYNEVKGNDIGRSVDGYNLGNGQCGIVITENASFNQVGAAGPYEGNVIAYSSSNGLRVASGAWNAVRGNAIYGNLALNLDLNGDGVTDNDPGDVDNGPNGLQNHPVLTSALASGQDTVIRGYLDSIPGLTFQIDFFASLPAWPSGRHGGNVYLETQTVTVPPTGTIEFTKWLSTAIPAGQFVTATATSVAGDTSEFSNAVQVSPDSDHDAVSDDEEDSGPNGGDGNADGLPDARQPGVTSIRNPLDGLYLVLEASPGSLLGQIQLQANPAPQTSPPGVSFPFGFVSFVLQPVPVGGAASVTIRLPAQTKIQTYYKYGPTPDQPVPHWYEFLYDGTTGAEIKPDRIVLHFVDGQRGDHDLQTNGVVFDPGGGAAPLAKGLSLVGFDSPDPVLVGAPLSFVYRVTNSGGEVARDVQFRADLPPEFVFVSATTSTGAAIGPAGADIVSVLGELAVDQTVDIEILVRAMGTGSFTARAEVHGLVTDEDPANNLVEVTTRVIALPSLTVNAADDLDDGVADEHHTSLREAIRLANERPGLERIVFAIAGPGPHTIALTQPLPIITDPLVIDGSTEPDYIGTPVIALDGSAAGPSNGLHITAGGSTIRGLAIHSMPTDGSLLTGNGIVLEKRGSCLLEGNYLGTDVTGTIPLPNQGAGVLVSMSTDNTIGGANPGAGNLISGNAFWGILLESGASRTNIEGNRIGTTSDGMQALANAGPGIEAVSGRNTIGGTVPGAANLISGNAGHGIWIQRGSDNVVIGNLIGTTADGQSGLGNQGHGIRVWAAQGNRIGGTDPGSGNTIAANRGSGVSLAGPGFLIATNDNRVQRNRIGTALDGVSPLGNQGNGVDVSFLSSGNWIGGENVGEGNWIAYNGGAGVAIDSLTSAIRVRGNAIWENGGLGIDLAAPGVTENDPGDLDLENSPYWGNQTFQNYPILSDAASNGSTTFVRGTIDLASVSLPFVGYRPGAVTLDFYSNPSVDPSGHGEGQRYLGSLTVAGSGITSFQASLPVGVTPGSFITATATDRYGNTSEFSPPVQTVPDSDFDGVLDSVEMAGPNGGDANADGIGDWTQAHVVSLPASTGAVVVTLVAEPGHPFRNVRAVANPSPTDAPPGVLFPLGLFEFDLEAAESTTVQILTPPWIPLDSVYNDGPEPNAPYDHWYQFLYDGTTGADFSQSPPLLRFLDRQRGDHDLMLNQIVEARIAPALFTSTTGRTLVVTTTADTGQGSLRDAIDRSNFLPGTDTIVFAIPADDPGHVYYRDDGVEGSLDVALVTPTSAVDDAEILDIDPDHPYSWWRIQPSSTPHPIFPNSRPRITFPLIIDAVFLDGYSQPGSRPATQETPAVLRIELDGSEADGTVDGLSIEGQNTVVRGLAINRFWFFQDRLVGGRQILLEASYGEWSSANNVIEGNHIGIDISGQIAFSLSPGSHIGGIQTIGIQLYGTSGNLIGGESPAQRNVIAGCSTAIAVDGSYWEDPQINSGNQILGNYIGTDATGTRALRNEHAGVRVINAPRTVIGRPEAGNLISGNINGIAVVHWFSQGVPGVVIQGNLIGTDASGTLPLGNVQGISIAGWNTLVGGTEPGAGNVVAASIEGGIQVEGFGDAPPPMPMGRTIIQGNWIGTDRTGTIDLGNADYGIRLVSTSDNQIGGAGPAANVIAYSRGPGIGLYGWADAEAAAFGNAIRGNQIYANTGLGIDLADPFSSGVNPNDHLDLDAKPHPISFPELDVSISGDITTVKGTLLAAPNRPYTLWIYFGSIGYGYDVSTDALGFHEFAYSYTNPGAFGQVNAEERNLIWPNRLQNYPVLTDARLAAGTTVVDGTFDSEPDETYRIEFFVNGSADESGYGEGEVYLGFQEVTTGPDGLASFSAILPIAVAYGQFLTATATDSEGNTSEFSAAFQVLPRFDQIDYGDAPGDLFGTRLSQNGARHAIVPGFHLGASIDGEVDGQPESNAQGDDSSGLDDEDGVRFPSPIVPGQVAVVEVTASANGFLDAWIDWNLDGQWDEAQERAFGALPVSEGRNLLSIIVPADALPGPAFGRFRFSSAGGLSPTGMAWDGEVEDYAVQVLPPPANRPPVARDDEGTTLAGLALAVPVLDNDNDPDGNLDPTTLTLVVVPEHGSVYVEASTGRILYTPDAGYVGEDRFQYEVRDSEGLSDWAAVVVTILGGNRPPVAADDLAQTAQGQPVTIPILANDLDADGDPMSLVSITDTGVPGRLVIDAQVVVFLPNSVFVGETAFAYTITDGRGGLASATVRVVVPPVNRGPIAHPDRENTLEGTPVVIDVAANDDDPDGNLDPSSVVLILGPEHGAAEIDPATGRVTYTPAPGFVGADRFDYSIRDREGLSASTRVWLDVHSRNLPPHALDDEATVNQESTVQIDVLANDSDPDDGLEPGSLRIINGPSNGSIAIEADPSVLRYRPQSGFWGTDRLVYEIRDRSGAASQAVVVLTVTPTLQGPQARDDDSTTVQGRSVLINAASNDSDPDGDLLPGSVRLTHAPRNGSTWIDPESGAILYTPRDDFSGLELFGYEIADENGSWDRALISVVVSPSATNLPPLAVGDFYTLAENERLIVPPPGLLGNDNDPEGQSLSAQLVSLPSHGRLTLNADGSFLYKPDQDYVGEDRFTYASSDGTSVSQPVTVSISVLPSSLIHFDRASYRVDEGDGLASISLVRSKGLGGRSTVVFTTTSGTATPGQDYLAVQILVVFEPGESVRTITFPILDDQEVEDDELVGLLLENPDGGAVLGSPASSLLTIQDNDRIAPDRTGPKVSLLSRTGYHYQPTRFQLRFDEDLDPLSATRLENYSLSHVLVDRAGRVRGFRPISIRSVSYDAPSRTVTVRPLHRLPLRAVYRIVVNGSGSLAPRDLAGNLLDGDTNGLPGGDFVSYIHRFDPMTPPPTIPEPIPKPSWWMAQRRFNGPKLRG